MWVDHFIGLDLRCPQDHTSLAVVERSIDPQLGQPSQYACRHLQRWPLGTAYPDILEDVGGLITARGPRGDVPLREARLVVDATAVGRAVVDIFREAPWLEDPLVSVMITAGMGAIFDQSSCSYHVPRKELAGVLQVLMQTGG
jgi:hypothetical protein